MLFPSIITWASIKKHIIFFIPLNELLQFISFNQILISKWSILLLHSNVAIGDACTIPYIGIPIPDTNFALFDTWMVFDSIAFFIFHAALLASFQIVYLTNIVHSSRYCRINISAVTSFFSPYVLVNFRGTILSHLVLNRRILHLQMMLQLHQNQLLQLWLF